MAGDGDNNEIDLRMLILILRQHFKLLVVITVVITLLGSLWILTRPKQYRYQQTIRLMHYYANGTLQVVQPTVEIEQLIKNIYLPEFQQQYKQQHPKTNVSISAGKGGNYQITSSVDSSSANNDRTIYDNGILYISAYGKNSFKSIISAANEYIFKQIMQEQAERSGELLKNIQAQIRILHEQLTELEKLQKAKNSYLIEMQNNKEKLSNRSDVTNILHDIYVSSLGVQQNQDNLIRLQIKLVDLLQYQIRSMAPVKLDKLIQSNKKHHITTKVGIILSFLIGLFLAIFLILIVNNLKKIAALESIK